MRIFARDLSCNEGKRKKEEGVKIDDDGCTTGEWKRKRGGTESKLIAGSIFHLAAWSPKVLFIRGNCNYSSIYRMMLPYMSGHRAARRVYTYTHIEREKERERTEKTLEGRGSNRCSIFLRQRFGETIGGNDFPRFRGT